MDYSKGGGEILVKNIFLQFSLIQEILRLFHFFLSYDSTDDLMPDFLGDINIRQPFMEADLKN